jgi:Flp pilus assembly protein CpaB
VHGAGVLADRLIAEQTDEQFDRIFNTKILGLRTLLEGLASDPLAILCMFSSVSARCGNNGQSTYAMANEILNKVAWAESRARGGKTLVKSLGWGPWEGGMVSPQLREHFASLELAEARMGLLYDQRHFHFVSSSLRWEQLANLPLGLLSTGMRAIAVEISPESASAGFILPDDRVDVILTYDVEVMSDRGMSDTTLTKTVIRNARVLAIDQMFGEMDGAPTLTGSTATLELEPRQAELLAHSSRLGSIALSLRSVADADENQGVPLANTSLLDGDSGAGGSGVRVFKNGNVSGGS